MNVVRSAGSRGRSDSYRKETENGINTPAITRPASSIDELATKTHFSREEIRHFYRTFKQDSPSGQVTKDHFISVMSTLFPTGECYRYSIFLFRNIDRANTGTIRFEDLVGTLSILIHGSLRDRLGWIFDLYDLNKDGKMAKMELLQLVASVFQLIAPVSKSNYTSITSAIQERTDQLFNDWDKRHNGYIYKEDFLECCLQVR